MIGRPRASQVLARPRRAPRSPEVLYEIHLSRAIHNNIGSAAESECTFTPPADLFRQFSVGVLSM